MESEFSRTINALPGLVWTALPDGDVDFVNRRWCEYTGLSADEARGSGWRSAVHPDSLPRILERRQSFLVTGEADEVEVRLRRRDGEYRWFRVSVNPMRDDAGKIVRWIGTNTDIEDRKKAEEDLRANERDLIQIINTIPTTAWATRPDGYCEFLSDRWLDYAGFTQEEAVGWGWARVIHPDDAAGLRSVWLNALATGTPVSTEARMRRFDGVYRWFLFLAQPLRDEGGTIIKWFGTNVDIEDRKRAEEELRRSEAFLAEGQRLNLSGSFVWRMDSEEVTFSDQLCRIYGFESGTRVTLELIASRLHPEDTALLADQQALVRAGERDLSFEFRLLMPDGSVKYLRTVAHATKDRTGRPEMIGAVQDVTEQQVSEEALSNVRSELARMTRVASLGALTASIAHEVSQPLSGIITNASTGLRMLAADPPNVDGALETVRRTLRDGNRASDVISKLRALFSHTSSVTEVVNLNEATREVIALLTSELQRNRVILRSEFADDLPPVIGDRIQLQQVILNLILNASDAMSAVDQVPRRLVIQTEHDGDGSVRVTVKDTGIGIDPKSADRLFDAFYTTKNGGMGMGLFVSRSIIESHGGSLWTFPNDGPGATFCFSIPRAPLGATGADHPGATGQSALNNPQSATRNL